MAIVEELIRKSNEGIDFGNYKLGSKAKLEGFSFEGDVYKIKTFKEITKLERNGLFAYESVPGTTVFNYKRSENGVSFLVEGESDAQITLELGEEKEYEIEIDGVNSGKIKTNLGGKLTINVETKEDTAKKVVVKEA
ncbi:MAG: endosialidase [Lachnospiraceae bacterium]|nr:endosialidase [Lachnospiraceae bacterium]